MSFGVPVVATLPTPQVTPSPQFEADLITWAQEIESKVEQKIVDADIALTGGDIAVHGVRTEAIAAAGGSLVGMTYDAATLYASAAAGGNTWSKELRVQPGQRIRNVRLYGRNSGVAWTVAVLAIDLASGGVSVLGSAASGTAAGTIEPKDVALSVTVLANTAYVVRFTAGAAGDRVLGGSQGVDRV